MIVCKILATVRGSGDGVVSTWIAESAPMARAVRRVSMDFGGPIVIAFMEVTEDLRRSRRRTASSIATEKTKIINQQAWSCAEEKRYLPISSKGFYFKQEKKIKTGVKLHLTRKEYNLP